jgi:nucleoporin NUP159
MSGMGNEPKANAATDLESIETEQLGFQALASENKLQLLPTPWSSEQFPITTASLLSVASGRGLLAAAGPDALVIATTESVREAASSGSKDKKKKPFTPQATIPVPRVSQVIFSSDESCLVISAEEGGGLAVYDTNGLLNGNKQSAFQIATNGVAVRQILANPSKENSHQFGLVLANGQLLLADLKQRQLVNGASGSPVFKENVSCACWSRLGKQIVAGLADGTAAQIDLQGNTKAVIPKPPQLMADRDPQEQGLPVSAIYWLETADFLMIHSPVNPPPADGDGMGPRNDSEYHLVHREKGSGECSYHQFMDPCPGFMEQRVPTHYFIQRLREWPPNLDDTLILSSTISSDIGTFTRSKVPLSQDFPADKITHMYTTTTPLEDSRRAALPVSIEDGMSETSVIGMALDLSTKEKVQKPIPSDEEIDDSATPLPALFVLNHEGVLSAWHVVYNESVREKTAYPGLIHTTLEEQPQQQTPVDSSTNNGPFGASSATQAQTPSQAPSQQPAFGQASTPAFGSASAFGASSSTQAQTPSQTPSQKSAFGQASTPAFGSTSAFGKMSSPWGAPPAASAPKAPEFGKPAGGAQFGAPSAFGATGGMGANKPSPWGSSTSNQTSEPAQKGPAFGGNTGGQSPFAAFSKQTEGDGKPAASPFSGFAKVGGFASTSGDKDKPAASPFGTFGMSSADAGKPQASAFGTFGQPSGGENKPNESPFSAFKKPQGEEKKPSISPFSASGSGGSAFGSFGDGGNTPTSPFASTGQQNTGMFAGSSFGSTVTLNSTTGSFASGAFGQGSSFGKTSFGQPSQVEAPKSSEEIRPSSGLGGLGGFKLGSTFKPDGSAKDDLPKPKDPGASLFGSGFADSLNKKPEPITPIKAEPDTEQSPNLNDIPEASNTPESPPKQRQESSKEDFSGPGLLTPQGKPDEASKQMPTSAQNDAPLPPDFLSSKPKKEASPPATDDAPLPPDFLGSKPKASDEGADIPIAGSPPLDVGDERFSESASEDDDNNDEEDGPPEDDGEVDWSEEDDQEQEDDEEDDEENEEEEDDEDDDDDDDEEEEEDGAVGDPEGLSAFEARISPASPTRKPQNEQSTTPETHKKTSHTPAGFPNPLPSFAPPTKSELSPRSPSPVRGSGRPPAAQRPSFGRTSVPPGRPVERPTSQQKAPAPQPPTQEELEDEEDARIKSILEAPIEPSTQMPEFIAHHNYVGRSDKPGLTGQFEKVYRDVNSMIDTLGLNARSLHSFVAGHSHARDNDSPMTRRDLEDEQDWVLAELDDLRSIIEGIGRDLENGRLEDPSGKIADCMDEEKELQKLKSRAADLRKQIAARTDPKQQMEHYNAPLPSESAAQQAELRQGVQRMQKQLAEAEEAMGILRADLASVPADGQAKGASNVPTVEAVTNTILKMTAMVQQRSGDVDVLESQIRRLPRGLASMSLQDDYEDDLINTMRGSKLLTGGSSSPATTPRPRRSRMTARGDPLGMSGMFGSRYARTTPTSGRQSIADLGASALGRSTASFGASTRKKMVDVSVEEAEGWLGREKSRKKVLTGLKDLIERRGVKEVKVSK